MENMGIKARALSLRAHFGGDRHSSSLATHYYALFDAHPMAGGHEPALGTGGYGRVWDFTEGPEGYEHCSQPMYSAQMAEFIDAVEAGRKPRPDGDDGAVVMSVVEQAYRSAAAR